MRSPGPTSPGPLAGLRIVEMSSCVATPLSGLVLGQLGAEVVGVEQIAAAATQGGTAIGDFQLVQAQLADMQAGVLAGEALLRECAREYHTGEDRRIAPSVAKLDCTEMVGDVADKAVQIQGGTGYMREVPVERIYREVRLLRLYEGPSDIHRLTVGGGPVREANNRLKG